MYRGFEDMRVSVAVAKAVQDSGKQATQLRLHWKRGPLCCMLA